MCVDATSTPGLAGMDPGTFRKLMSQLPAAVCVATTVDRSGVAHGMTASSVTSVSLDPPLLLICVARDADFHAAMLESGGFVINVLSETQQDLSRRFAEKGRPDRFADVRLEDAAGIPRLAGAVATIVCEHWQTVPAGDHTIFLGQIREGAWSDRPPLLHFRSRYARVADAN